MPSSCVYPELEQLLPHRAPMIFLDRVVAADAGQIRCQAKVKCDHPLLFQGKLPPSVLLEYLAQAAAAHRALTLAEEQQAPAQPAPGYLVLIRQASFTSAPVAGQQLEIRARLSEQRPPFFTYDGAVSCGKEQLCRTRFTVATEADGR